MKQLLIILLGVFMLASCTKNHDDLAKKQDLKSFLNYEFVVGEQVNVNKYEIEVSTDGITFQTVAYVLAFDNVTTYKAKVEITDHFKNSDRVYSRIKSVDNDGKILYSTVSMVRDDTK